MPYLNVVEVESALSTAASAPYTAFTQLIALPNATWEGRQCHALKLANGSGVRPGVYFLGGVHAREWGSPDILINFIEQMAQAYQGGTGLTYGSKTFSADDIKSIVDTLDIVVFPQANPDGRNYSMNSDPMWRKNRRTAAPNTAVGDCTGVDINRNFDFLWNFPVFFSPAAAAPASTNPCDPQVYNGPSAFSEPETQNAKWIFDNYPNVAYFVDLHSYSEDILYSWGDDQDQSSDPTMNFQNAAFNGQRGVSGDAYKEYIPATDLSSALALANAMHDGIQAFRGKNYSVKPSYDLYPTSGASDDYSYSRHFVDPSKQNVLSYTLEWGTEFHPDYSEMQNIIQEITCGLIAFCLQVRNSIQGPPSITSFSPSSGDPAGGAIVVITGSGFAGATAVNFGANGAVTFNVDSTTQITAVAPAGSGSVVISVVNPLGNTTSGTQTFTYTAPVPPPQIVSVSPGTGPTAGGTSVVITGAGFTGVVAVTFGATPAASFNVDSATQITATSPASNAGTVDISLTGPSGTSSATAADRFMFVVPLPAVTGIAPNFGPLAGGTSVAVTGAGFTGATSVTFGAIGATFTLNSDTSIATTSPAGSGQVDVLVTTPAGTSAAVASDQFTFTSGPPVVTGINPPSGSTLGGDSVVITGSGFTGATAVGFGNTGSPTLVVNSDTQITVTSPAGTGTVDVTVTTPVGASPTSAADQFTYTAATAPVITNVSPNSGAGAGGDSIVLTGSNFTGATTVNFGANAATPFNVDSDTQITVTSPAGGGTVDVTVIAPGGTSATGPADQFTYTTPGLPAVTNVTPNTGSTAGGDSVVLTGIGFTGATDVSIGPASVFFNVDSDIQITATTPAGTGTVDIIVTTPVGVSAINPGDQFTYF
jgi:murein tripeptide amidase MpaA